MKAELKGMLYCDVCRSPASFGFGVTLAGIRRGDVGNWRCAEHHPAAKPHYTREQWERARAAGALYPTLTPTAEESDAA